MESKQYNDRLEQESKTVAEKLNDMICDISNPSERLKKWADMEEIDRVKFAEFAKPLAAYVLEKMAEAGFAMYHRGGAEIYNCENSTRDYVAKPAEHYLETLGLIPSPKKGGE